MFLPFLESLCCTFICRLSMVADDIFVACLSVLVVFFFVQSKDSSRCF